MKSKLIGTWPWPGINLGVLLALVWAITPSAAATAAAGTGSASMPLVVDVSGMSGEWGAVLLNPAAATGLQQPFLALDAAGGTNGAEGPYPQYTLVMMDAGELAGGMVAQLESPPARPRDWQFSYTVAGQVGGAALGTRVNYKRVPLADGDARDLWYLDVGVAGQLSPAVGIGLAAYRLKVHESWPGLDPPGGRLGMTLSPPKSEGLLVGMAVAIDDLETMHGRRLEVGFILPLGERTRLRGAYQRPLGGTAGTVSTSAASLDDRWSLGLTIEWTRFHLELGYRSDEVYHIGLRADL